MNPALKRNTLAIVNLALAIVLTMPAMAYAETTQAQGTGVDITTQKTTSKPAPPTALYAGRADSTTLHLDWVKASDADGYMIYRKDPGSKSYKKVAKVAGRESTWFDYNKTTGKTYVYKMRSYKTVNGKKVYSAYTYAVSTKAHSASSKTTNVISITAPKKITLGLREEVELEAKANASDYTSYKSPKPTSAKLYYSRDNKNISITKAGVITGKKVGTTTVTIRSHNGRLKTVQVTVVDYAKPKKFETFQMPPRIAQLVKANKTEICEIASYFAQHEDAGKGVLYLDQNDNLVNPSNIDLGPMQDYIYQFLYNAPYGVVIQVGSTQIIFTIYIEGGYESIEYLKNHDLDDADGYAHGMRKVAPHWFTEIYFYI